MLLFQIKENQTLLRMVAPNFARCKEWVGEPDDQPLKIFQRCILIGGQIGIEPAGLVDNDQAGSKMHEHEHTRLQCCAKMHINGIPHLPPA